MGMPGFLFLSFPCSSSSHTFHSLRKAYTFFIILGFGSLHSTHTHLGRVHLYQKTRFALATKLYPVRLPSDGVSGTRSFLHEDIQPDYRYSSLHGTPSSFPEAITSNDHLMIRRNSNVVTINMGRGAYDTTGTLKPGQPPPPKPR
ncbi:hypothetical protein E4T42_07168 [Aureobasidium subglaciale]|nr:hypothetical protein E4T38_02047 [Aureobasidium subglaciale]KAI5229018.1 hypothetical protein E4T40_01847 [Aureobasidium subglaciale]KAI5232820.1 hypothetical protein E4T41_02067 [Aureobasidium subglaciale]KAI5244201.1 hypothetical protein E4T42_07168 [Aureobasidium subglaciale]KAI5266030.1 hypothetical protein E4T46_01824 [Aureobasidium subglaciale]